MTWRQYRRPYCLEPSRGTGEIAGGIECGDLRAAAQPMLKRDDPDDSSEEPTILTIEQ